MNAKRGEKKRRGEEIKVGLFPLSISVSHSLPVLLFLLVLPPSPVNLWPRRVVPGHHVGLVWNGLHGLPQLLPKLAGWILPCTWRHQIHVSISVPLQYIFPCRHIVHVRTCSSTLSSLNKPCNELYCATKHSNNIEKKAFIHKNCVNFWLWDSD